MSNSRPLWIDAGPGSRCRIAVALAALAATGTEGGLAMNGRMVARLLLIGLCATGVAGCGSYFIAKGVEPTAGVDTIGIGVGRNVVEEILGEPVASDATDSGTVARYRYNRGRPPKSIDHEAVAWEAYAFVFQPLVWLWVAGAYHQQKGTLRIAYGADETVTEIGRLLNEWDVEKERTVREAFQVALRNAECGDRRDQFRVGRMYESGRGPPGEPLQGNDYVRRDIETAYLWYALAAAEPISHVIKARDAAAEKMTSGQIAKAERLAGEWRPDPSSCDVEIGRPAGAG